MSVIEQKYISIPQVAKILGFSPNTVRNHFKRGLIKDAIRIGKGHIRIPIDSEYFSGGKKPEPEPTEKPIKFMSNHEKALWLKNFKGSLI